MPIDPQAVKIVAQKYTAAWNSKSAEAVASFYAEDGQISINRADPYSGTSGIIEMASGFYADVPDLSLTCDDIRCAGSHAVFVWTFTGHDSGTGNPLKVHGWEEWELDEELKVKASLGWYDADDYARQVEAN